jgi:hypothetical protein
MTGVLEFAGGELAKMPDSKSKPPAAKQIGPVKRPVVYRDMECG